MGQGWAVQNKYARIEIEKKEHQKALDERDKEIEQKTDKEDRPEFIEFYKYENRKFKIIKEDGIYQAISYQMVIGDEDLEVLKDKKIPEYVENEIKNKRGID
ncbi:hypothetical protein [Clostridium perfringens]|uniref:hypothetical protein n=1 Tax=Clostridium perfringens TaxID=1502 RepID=UPI00111FAAA9|nr:hypothetical protein [Clostridium perfringens]MDK0957276.1 hypothetical protein [Clostridium perfringens]TPE21172.1 hypothetical protein FJM09_07080 [Clostridium perfringens]